MSEPASLLIVAEDDGLRSRAPTADDIAEHLLAQPDLAWAVLELVAPRVVGPWHAVEWPPGSHIRSVPPPWDGDYWSAECWAEARETGPTGEYGVTVWPGESRKKWSQSGYPSLDEAKAAADNSLRAAGCVLAGETGTGSEKLEKKR